MEDEMPGARGGWKIGLMLTERKKPAGGSAVRSQRKATAAEEEVAAAVGGISCVGRLQRQHEPGAAGKVRMSHSGEQLI